MIAVPIEIVNKILVYVGELNHEMIITQYDICSREAFYKLNWHSNLLWQIKASLRMKQLYPLYPTLNGGGFTNKSCIKLYQSGVLHYQKELQLTNN
jgi:hypothetical protein